MRAVYDEKLIEQIKLLHVGHKRNYGAVRMHILLKAIDYPCSRRRVNRLMIKSGVQSRYHAFRYKKRDGGTSPVADNLLAKITAASEPGQHWAGDMTYLKTNEGPIFMAAVLDLFSRKVIGWSFSTSHDANLVDSALRMSLSRENKKSGCLFHSDQGAEYRSALYRKTIEDSDMISSMSRAGNPTDNAYVESFFGTLKNELVYHWKFKTKIECVARIIDYIEFYNETRLHSGLGYLSPESYEMMNT